MRPSITEAATVAGLLRYIPVSSLQPIRPLKLRLAEEIAISLGAKHPP